MTARQKTKRHMSTALLLLSIRHFLSLSCIPVWATECVRLRVGQGAQQAGRNSKEKDLIFPLKQETYVDPKKKKRETSTLWWTCWCRWLKFRAGENTVVRELRKPLGGGLEWCTNADGWKGGAFQKASGMLVRPHGFDARSVLEK